MVFRILPKNITPGAIHRHLEIVAVSKRVIESVKGVPRLVRISYVSSALPRKSISEGIDLGASDLENSRLLGNRSAEALRE
jgi:hypothetical protein